MNTTGVPTVAWISGTVLLLAILGGLFALAWHGTISGTAVVGVVVTVVGIVGAIFGMHVGSTASAKTVIAMKSGSGS